MESANPDDNATEQPSNPNLPKWYTNLLKMSEEMSQEDRDMFPPDYSENLDHYLYGMPKKSPGPFEDAPSVERNDGMENSHTKEKRSEQSENPALDFHRRLIERSKRIPQEELDEFPPDFSENLDYYLYGMPKKSP